MTIKTSSAQYDNQQTSKRVDSYDLGKTRTATFEYVNTGDAGQGLANLITLPAGKIRVNPLSCAIWVSENGADESFVDGATLDIGYAAYSEPDGTSVVADEDYWVAMFNPAATHEKRFSLPAGGGALDASMPRVFNTKLGLTVTLDVDSFDMKVGAKVYGHLVFAQGN